MTLDDNLEWMKEYEKDFDYFHVIRDDLCNKHKNKFVAIKNLKVCHDASPLKLLELLKAEDVDTIMPL